MPKSLTFQEFKKTHLVKNLTDKWGQPKHTRLIKNLFYMFSTELKKEYNFDMRRCTICKKKDSWNGKPLILQLDHINGINNDSRLSNLRMLCPNCHSQTSNFCNRKTSLKKYHREKVCHAAV